jgi:hypothetical protein
MISIDEFFYDDPNITPENPWRPLPKHSLWDSPCYPIIGMHDKWKIPFYYCKLHHDVENKSSSESWFTEDQKRQANNTYRSLAFAAREINARQPNLYQFASLRCYRQGVLAKYITNDLVDIGNCDKQISFLSPDRKNAESTVNFYNTNHGILMIQAHELVKLPPKERGHWEEYEIPLTFQPV